MTIFSSRIKGFFRNFWPVESAEGERDVPFRTLLKGTSIITLAPFMLLAIYVVYGKLSLEEALFGWLFVLAISLIFVRPYIANLSALTRYVENLASDKKAKAPDLSFLNNVEVLSSAVDKLQNSWEQKRHQLEMMLAESRILIDSLPEIVVLVDVDLNVIRTNQKALEQFGENSFDSVIVDVVSNPAVRSFATQVLTFGIGKSLEFKLDDPWQQDYILRIERFPSYSPEGIALIIVMQNITERKNVERMLSDFVANASHEIRTPLTGVLGIIETLQTTAKNDKKAQQEFLKVMQAQAEHMALLVKDLLSLSQIERTIHAKLEETISPEKVVREAILLHRTLLKKKNIKLKLSLAKDLPSFKGDFQQMLQVLHNLISNAIKYSPENTEIEIITELTKNRTTGHSPIAESANLIAITVKDQGEGFAKEHIPRLTERFYRVDRNRKKAIGGTGLGLAIVKSILDRHHATLAIKSTPGKGSSFSVLLTPIDIKSR